MDEADETMPLLTSVDVAIDKNKPTSLPSTAEEAANGNFGDSGHGSSLRRHSSACLPPFHETYEPSEEPSSNFAIWTVVPILLLGVFVANADGSLIIASSQHIASEFNALADASWLVSSYVLAQCASQSLYGKLSDIFGRKSNLITSYIFFAGGCFLCGVGQKYWQVLAGRAVSGIGGAGMTALVSIIIADMVPVRQVAVWRSYVNVAATLGRSLGGPVGGWLTDTIGWRWCFYGQCPLSILGLLLILWKLPSKTNKSQQGEEQPLSQKIQRVDMIGAFVLASTISCFLLTLDFIARRSLWYHSLISGLLGLLFAVLFFLIESRWAKEPILPIQLLIHRDALTAYLIAGFQIAAQFGFFYSVPIYFQIAGHASVTAAGLRLVPAVIGNATGGLLSGYIISKTGRYKKLTIFASVMASTGYLLVLIRWRGATNLVEVMYIFLGGFGMGIIQSTTFIHLAASLDQSEMAIAGTTLYLAQSVFLLLGIQLATTVLHARLRTSLQQGLQGIKHRSKVIKESESSISFIWRLPKSVQQIVIRAYVDSLTYTYGKTIIYLCIYWLASWFIHQRAETMINGWRWGNWHRFSLGLTKDTIKTAPLEGANNTLKPSLTTGFQPRSSLILYAFGAFVCGITAIEASSSIFLGESMTLM